MKTFLPPSVSFGISYAKICVIGQLHDRANHAQNDVFTWQQRRIRQLRAGTEGIIQLTSNQGGSENLGYLQAYDLKQSGDSSDLCLETMSGCQHVRSTQEFDPVLHVKVCLCITRTYSHLHCRLFGFPFGVKATRLVFCSIRSLI